MIDDLKPYPAMKDSGVPWLGEVPEHWSVRRMKRVATLNPSKSEAYGALKAGAPATFLPMSRVGADGRVDAREIHAASALWNGFTYFRRGDVLVAKITPCFENGKGACLDTLSTAIGFGSTEFIVARATDCLLPRFLHRVTTLAEFRRLGADAMIGAAGQQRVPTSFVADFHIPLPSLDEQAAIVRFLDHADRRIRRYIRAKQKLIKLLEEQKQAIIHRAVTRGLDPNVRLKPSGVEWLGDVPEHWEVRRLKSLVKRIDQGVSPQAENYLADATSWGVVKAGCVNRGLFREEEHKRLPASFRIDTSLKVAEGDVLVSRASGSPNLVGSVGRVHTLRYRLILSDKTFRPVFVDGVDSDFMVLAMNSRYYREQVEQAISGAEGLANNLPLSSLRSFRFAVPTTLAEQKVIVREVHAMISALQDSVIKAEREISLLREYRTRLIADVVTGKLDVREAAARLPQDAEDLEPIDEAEVEGDAQESDAGDGEAVPEEAEA